MRSTMQQEFEQALRVHRDRIAIRFAGAEHSYRDVDRWSATIAGQLRQAGIGVDDRVALYVHNTPEFIVADVAVARLGATKVPVNYMLAVDSVEYILEASGVRALVVDGPLAAGLRDFLAAHPDIAVLQLDDGGQLLPGAQRLVAAPAADAEVPETPLSGAASGSTAAIYFTGGTTGKPKGVVHSQASTVALHYAQLLEGEILESEQLLLMTPLAHAAGLFAQSALIRGATIELHAAFDAAQAVELIVAGAVTWAFLVPTMIYRMLDLLSERDHGELRLRTIVYGAAPISPDRLKQGLELFGPVFIQLYGQTESPNWGTRLTKSDHDLSRPELLTSCGRASIMTEVKVVGEDGAELPPGQTGEICLRSPYVLDSYLDNPGATSEKFLGEFIRTGDIGEMNEDGYLYLRDRKNDMIISGGMNVYSREVEDVLAGHPAVRAVAVIGIPHPDWGEAVHAVLVTAPDAAVEPEQIIAWSRERLAAYARPKSVDIVEALPETAFGKVDKKALRQPFWAAQGRGIS